MGCNDDQFGVHGICQFKDLIFRWAINHMGLSSAGGDIELLNNVVELFGGFRLYTTSVRELVGVGKPE